MGILTAIIILVIMTAIAVSPIVMKIVKTKKYNNTSSDAQDLADRAGKPKEEQDHIEGSVIGSEHERDIRYNRAKQPTNNRTHIDSRFINAKHEQDMRYMREAGVDEEELRYSEIIFDTGSGYGGKLITYNSRERQFSCHSYLWHIDDSQEFYKTEPCSPEQAVSIIADCNHDSKRKLSVIDHIAELSGSDRYPDLPDGGQSTA